MRDVAILFVHLIATLAKLMCPGGTRAVIAEACTICLSRLEHQFATDMQLSISRRLLVSTH